MDEKRKVIYTVDLVNNRGGVWENRKSARVNLLHSLMIIKLLSLKRNMAKLLDALLKICVSSEMLIEEMNFLHRHRRNHQNISEV